MRPARRLRHAPSEQAAGRLLAAHIDEWLRAVAPSDELRRWFAHDPARWEEFRRRYRDELRGHSGTVDRLAGFAHQHGLTLVFGARDEQHTNAVVLRDVLEEHHAAPGDPHP